MKDYDTIDNIIREEMLATFNSMNTKSSIPFVSHNPKVEKKFVNKMRKAAKRIYNYYSMPEDKIE